MSAIVHGTQNGYGNLGCRCDDCTAAHRAYEIQQRAAPCAGGCGAIVEGRYRPGTMCTHCRREARLTAEHGSEGRYARGCRCDLCRAGAAAGRRRRRAAERERVTA